MPKEVRQAALTAAAAQNPTPTLELEALLLADVKTMLVQDTVTEKLHDIWHFDSLTYAKKLVCKNKKDLTEEEMEKEVKKIKSENTVWHPFFEEAVKSTYSVLLESSPSSPIDRRWPVSSD